MTHPFDVDTAMEPAGEGLHQGRMSRRWWIYAGPNGGYVAATILNGLAQAVGDTTRTPRSLTVHFTERPEEGPVCLETRVERAGRKMTTVSGRLVQNGRTVAAALAAFSSDREGIEYCNANMPAVPAPEECPSRDAPPGALPPMHDRLDMRWALGPFPFTGARAEGEATARAGAWIRPVPARKADPAFVALLSDAVTPSIFGVLDPREGIVAVPTVDLTVHFRNHVPETVTADDYFLAAFSTRLSTGGFVEEDGEIWTRDGVLLAQSRQLAVVL